MSGPQIPIYSVGANCGFIPTADGQVEAFINTTECVFSLLFDYSEAEGFAWKLGCCAQKARHVLSACECVNVGVDGDAI